MKTKLEEMDQDDIDRLLNIEKEALSVVSTMSAGKKYTLNCLVRSVRPMQKPKYTHNDKNEASLKFINPHKELKIYRSNYPKRNKDHDHLKLTKLLLDYKDTYCPDYTWSRDKHDYFISLNHDTKKCIIESNYNYFNPTNVYMTKEVANQLVQDIKDGVVDIELPKGI